MELLSRKNFVKFYKYSELQHMYHNFLGTLMDMWHTVHIDTE